ncbi:RHO1 GDP-GTP exchange protein 2 [Polyrhizophydium stewartii]|uniref:RHO1 GDP-GTP exchange protein 2 n=1 Tax=Polyrhizophydium stewartii TaxID=2732419 RepID=A0ABR4NF90_9FUNG
MDEHRVELPGRTSSRALSSRATRAGTASVGVNGVPIDEMPAPSVGAQPTPAYVRASGSRDGFLGGTAKLSVSRSTPVRSRSPVSPASATATAAAPPAAAPAAAPYPAPAVSPAPAPVAAAPAAEAVFDAAAAQGDDGALLSAIARRLAHAAGPHGPTMTGRELLETLKEALDTADAKLAQAVGAALLAQNYIVSGSLDPRAAAAVAAGGVDAADMVFRIRPLSLTTPIGVFVPLTRCYAPRCSDDGPPCYSPACPRRIEAVKRDARNVARSLTKLYGGTGAAARQNTEEIDIAAQPAPPAASWHDSVAPHILEATPPDERKRQEVIFELINGERDYVKDLESVMRIFMSPISTEDIVPEGRRIEFINGVFLNIAELLRTNKALLLNLVSQQRNLVVSDGIGEAFLGQALSFEAYIDYGAKQPLAKALLDEEIAVNAKLSDYLDACRSYPELRKLPLTSFLAAPTTRFARYPLLLKEIIKRTPDDNPDKAKMAEAMQMIQTTLTKLNYETGRAENMLRLTNLSRLLLQPEYGNDALRLSDEGRQIIREGKLTLVRRPNADLEVNVFLFDHMLVIAKEKDGSFKCVRRAVPLELLVFGDASASSVVGAAVAVVGAATVVSGAAFFALDNPARARARPADINKPQSFTLSFAGREPGQMTFIATSYADLVSWVDAIEKQRNVRRQVTAQLYTRLLWRGPLDPVAHESVPSSTTVFDDRLLVASSSGVYSTRFLPPNEQPILSRMTAPQTGPDGAPAPQPPINLGPASVFHKVIDIKRVSKIDVQRESQSLLVLGDKTLYTYAIDVFEAESPHSAKGRKVATPVNFFKQGKLMEQPLVCTVHSQPLNSSIKVWRPTPVDPSHASRGRFRGIFGGGASDALRLYKELYVPSESRCVDFLNSMLCVGSTKGFEMIQLSTLKTQGLLDERDELLQFMASREIQTPISVFRVPDGTFLLCFQEFSFFIDKFGKRAKGKWIVNWHGTPTDYAMLGNFLIAFDPAFIEIRSITTGALVQIITIGQICGEAPMAALAGPGPKLRVLNTRPDLLHLAAGPSLGVQLVPRPLRY